jgi:hypothetical protein
MRGDASRIEQNFLQPAAAAGASTVLFRQRGLGWLLRAMRGLAVRSKPAASQLYFHPFCRLFYRRESRAPGNSYFERL